MNITIIGTDYHALAYAAILASYCNDVICLGDEKLKISDYKHGFFNINDHQLTTLLKENLEHIRFTTNAKDAIRPNKIVILTLSSFDDILIFKTNLNLALQNLSRHSIQDTYLIVLSIVPQGTYDYIFSVLKNSPVKFHVVYAPIAGKDASILSLLKLSRMHIGVSNDDDMNVFKHVVSQYMKAKVQYHCDTAPNIEKLFSKESIE